MAIAATQKETPAQEQTLTPASRRKYASVQMFDRKRRILTEAQAMLDEEGVENFTIRGLSKRADVAQRTLYNVFGSKEDIIASAVELHFQSLIDAAPGPITPGDLDGLLARRLGISNAIVRLRRYAKAMTGVFVSPDGDPKIHESLLHIWHTGSGGAWLEPEFRRSFLVRMPAEKFDAIIAILINSDYCNIGDWVSDRISESEFRRRSMTNHLLILRGYFKPSVRARADEIISDYYRGAGA
jgi:AcrR family transcriptional regulator